MIAFPCPCGHKFEFPVSEAGGLTQCPRCHRLNDIPLLSDLEAIDADGTLMFADDAPRSAEPGRLAELHRAFGRERTDGSGNEIDLRQTFDELRKVGGGSVPLSGDATPAAPRYDPLTGELVRDIDLAPTAPRAVIPIGNAAPSAHSGDPRTLQYSRRMGGTVRRRNPMDPAPEIPTLASLPIRLFDPVNLVVMFFVMLLFLAFSATTLPIMGGLFFAAPAPILVGATMVAHFGNVIRDLGPGEEDELPTPLRYASFGEDIWWPFVRMFFSLMICFAPALIFSLNTSGIVMAAGGGTLLVAGVLLFPIIALTLCGSGHAGNLRPDRILALLVLLGPAYIPAIALCAVALLLNAATSILCLLVLHYGVTTNNVRFFAIFTGSGIVVACLATYIGHLAAWWLAVLYRKHEAQIPWHFEEHERARAEDKRLKTLAEIERHRTRKFARA